MAEKEAEVIVFPKRFQGKKIVAAPHSEGAYFVDFKSCGKRIHALRTWHEYATTYTEDFLALEEECHKLMNSFVMFGCCAPGYAAGKAANNFLASGSLVQKVAKKLEGRVPAVSSEAQKTARQLRAAIQGIPMQRKGVKKDLYAELLNIIDLCYQLRDVLYPLRREAKASQPAHA